MKATDLIERLNEDEYLLEAFRSNPLAVVDRCNMTIGEVIDIGRQLKELRQCSLRDYQAYTILLEFIAKNPESIK